MQLTHLQTLNLKIMQNLKFSIETETTVKVSHYNELWRVQPSIGQLKEAYNSLLNYLDDLAEDSDPDITDDIIAFCLIRPSFEQLTIEDIQTADYDQTGDQWDHIFLIRFSFTISNAEYKHKFNKTFNIFGTFNS